MARGNVRCGSIASPAEKVTYCQPSYAHRTLIMPRPMPDRSDGVIDSGQNDTALAGGAPCEMTSAVLLISRAPTLIAVLQFWTSSLRLVLRTLIAATMPSSATAVSF